MMRAAAALMMVVLAGCQANPPYAVESLRFDEGLIGDWVVEGGGGVLAPGTVLTIKETEVPEAQGRVNPPLARLGVTAQGRTNEEERAYRVEAPGVSPPAFDAYLLDLDGREVLGLPLLNRQREEAGTA